MSDRNNLPIPWIQIYTPLPAFSEVALRPDSRWRNATYSPLYRLHLSPVILRSYAVN